MENYQLSKTPPKAKLPRYLYAIVMPEDVGKSHIKYYAVTGEAIVLRPYSDGWGSTFSKNDIGRLVQYHYETKHWSFGSDKQRDKVLSDAITDSQYK